MGFPPPQFNVPLLPNQIAPELPFYPIYGVTPDNRYIPISVDQMGRLEIGAEIGPITIGDVNIKGYDPVSNTYKDIAVNDLGLGNGYSLRSTLFDGANHLKINADGSINVTGFVVISPTEEQHVVDSPLDLYIPGVSKGNMPTMRVVSTPPTLTPGEFSSSTLTPAGRLIVDGSQVTQPISAVALPLPANAAKETGGNLSSIHAGIQTLNSLVPSVYDYIDLQYSGNDLTKARFYLGGPGGTLVSTLTLMYTGANLTSVQRS